MPKIIDMTGQTSGRLTVLRLAGIRAHRARWVCRCICGKETEVIGANLRRGLTHSCGCLHHELFAENSRHAARHGHKRGGRPTTEYSIWQTAKRRCFSPAAKDYPRYGGRGITMCPEWRDNFEVFLRDMGMRPSLSHSIDRIDNDGPYCKKNCRWVVPVEQQNNRRGNRHVLVNGQRLTIAQAVRVHGVKRSHLCSRLQRSSTTELHGVIFEVA